MFFILMALSAAAPAPFAFKDYILGATIADVKALPQPPGKYGPRKILCSDDPGSPSWLVVSGSEREATIVRCRLAELIGGSYSAASIDLNAEHAAGAEFTFFQNRLYKIQISPDLSAETLVNDGLVARFGPATLQGSGAMQIRSGATIPQKLSTWARPNQKIVMTAPDYAVRKMSVIYTDLKIGAQAENAWKRAQHPEGAM